MAIIELADVLAETTMLGKILIVIGTVLAVAGLGWSAASCGDYDDRATALSGGLAVAIFGVLVILGADVALDRRPPPPTPNRRCKL